jgi:hypothetical protein
MSDEIDRFLEAYTPDIRDLTHQVRALIASVTPDADEYLKRGWKVIWYGFGPRMPDQFAVVMPTRNHVGLGFAYGSDLPDPKGKLEGTGKRMRHVKLRTGADVSDPALAALIRAQVALMRAGAGGSPSRATPPNQKAPSAKRKTPSRPKARKGSVQGASPRRTRAAGRKGAGRARAR